MTANTSITREKVWAVLRRTFGGIAAKRLQITLSVAAIFLAAAHILTGYKIDTIGLALIFLAVVPWIIPFLRENLKTIEVSAIGKVEFLEKAIVLQGSQIELHQIQINQQQEMINKLLIYSAMTYFEFEILARIYHASRNGGEYIFKKNENFERQLRFLRDHGYIDPHTQIRNLRDGENLIGIVQLTDAGKSFVELREQYESGTNADTVQRDIVH